MKKLLACTIETRLIPNLVQYIQDHMKYLSDCDLAIVCSSLNQELLHKEFPDALLFSVDRDLNNTQMYNKLLTSPAFWQNFVDWRRVLIFQHDSMILRPGIEEFLDMPFGYYGAPFWFQTHGGNGGMSLRNPRLMKDVCDKYAWGGENEDIFYSNTLYTYFPEELAPRYVCEKWGVESVFKLGTFSAHSPEKWLSTEQCHQIKTQYLNQ